MVIKKIKIGKSYIEALSWKMSKKSLVVLKGSKGYIMCGYLNMQVANMFDDVAVMIRGVSTVADALKATVAEVSMKAHALGIRKNQPISDVLKILV